MRGVFLTVAISAALMAPAPATPQGASPIELVVVTGRQPGPPLWRVSNGDNQLYIFATFSPVPKGMIWDSERIARVIGDSQEVIYAPDVDADFSLGLMLNPINLLRGRRLAKRLTRNADGATLDEVLPPELYARYETLRTGYFPRESRPPRERPFVAGTRLGERIQREEGLVNGDQVAKQLRRMIRRNKDLKETRVEVTLSLKGSFGDLARRAQTLVDSLAPDQELACFTEQIERLETDLDAMKSRANAWAQGYVDEFRNHPLPGDEADACFVLLRQSSELGTIEQVREELNAQWLAAVDRALADNASTFAILDLVELVREDDGLLQQLADRGYEIWAP